LFFPAHFVVSIISDHVSRCRIPLALVPEKACRNEPNKKAQPLRLGSKMGAVDCSEFWFVQVLAS
jgi:hypothetical protein